MNPIFRLTPMSKPQEDATVAAGHTCTTNIHAKDKNPHVEHIQDFITQMNANIRESVTKWYTDLSTVVPNDPGLQQLEESVNSSIHHVQTQHLDPWMKNIREGAEEAQKTSTENNECPKKCLQEFSDGVNKSVTDAWEKWCKDYPEQAKALAQKNHNMNSYLEGLQASISEKIEEAKNQYSTYQEKFHKKNCEPACDDEKQC